MLRIRLAECDRFEIMTMITDVRPREFNKKRASRDITNPFKKSWSVCQQFPRRRTLMRSSVPLAISGSSTCCTLIGMIVSRLTPRLAKRILWRDKRVYTQFRAGFLSELSKCDLIIPNTERDCELRNDSDL